LAKKGKIRGLYHQVKNLEVKGDVLFLEVDGKRLEVDLKQISPDF
jgi:hypothetical protein